MLDAEKVRMDVGMIAEEHRALPVLLAKRI